MNKKSLKISVQNATVGFRLKKKDKKLLKNITVSGEEEELIALIGINGSGKSTLLRTLIGLEVLLSGEIKIDGKNHNEYNKTESARKIAFVSSEIVNTRYLKVKDLVALGRFPHQKISNQYSEKDKRIVDTALKTVGMHDFKERLITEISDGERQKVMTARALAQETDIILLDEPAAFLDLANKFSLYKILSDTAKKLHKTVIFSTHDLNIALKYCDKVWLIKNKTIVEGAPEDLFLSGILQNIFPDGHVIFNALSFEFSVKTEPHTPVNIFFEESSEEIKLAVLNALKRKGFYRTEEKTKISVRIKKNDYKIFTDDYTFFADSINNLLKTLTEMNLK